MKQREILPTKGTAEFKFPYTPIATNVNLDKVHKLYDKVVSVEEFKTKDGWTSILNDGSDVRNNEDMKYHYFGIEGIVQKCIDSGATVIQFLCRHGEKEACYPDYRVDELLK